VEHKKKKTISDATENGNYLKMSFLEMQR